MPPDNNQELILHQLKDNYYYKERDGDDLPDYLKPSLDLAYIATAERKFSSIRERMLYSVIHDLANQLYSKLTKYISRLMYDHIDKSIRPDGKIPISPLVKIDDIDGIWFGFELEYCWPNYNELFLRAFLARQSIDYQECNHYTETFSESIQDLIIDGYSAEEIARHALMRIAYSIVERLMKNAWDRHIVMLQFVEHNLLPEIEIECTLVNLDLNYRIKPERPVVPESIVVPAKRFTDKIYYQLFRRNPEAIHAIMSWS